MKKRLLTALPALILAMSILPITVSAAEGPDYQNVTVSVKSMSRNIAIEYNIPDAGSVRLDQENPARGERVTFVENLSHGFKVREITARIGSKSVPVYRSADGVYCFDMPRLREDETLVFTVTIVEEVTVRYTRSGSFGGQLTLSRLVKGQRYVCQLSEADGMLSSCTIITFIAQDAVEKLDVRSSTGGYIVSLWKYDAWAVSVEDLTNVFYEVSAE